MKQSGISCIFLIILLAACDSGSQRRFNKEALQEEMRNREPKKVSEAQIITAAYQQGQFIAEEAQKELLSTLHKVVEEDGTARAVHYCSTEAYPLIDSLSQKYNAEIGRTSMKLRNPANAPDETEKQLLEAYEYNAENNQPLDDNVQRLNQEYLLYTKPIVIAGNLCLRCHGEPEKDIEPKTLTTIDSLYPNDKARHYEIGEFRGIWSITLKQKDLVNAL